MGFNKMSSNMSEFFNQMKSNVGRWKKNKKYTTDKSYKSGIDKIESAVNNNDYDSLEMIMHQLKTGRSNSVHKDFSSDIWRTGDRVFHNKRMKDSYDLSPELRNKVTKL